MPAEALKCKECSTTYPLEARYVCERCFGPLEVAYRAPASDADELRAPDPGRPELALALRGLPPARARPARVAADGHDAARARRPPGRAARPRRGVDQERDREPDALVQGPRRVGRARPRGGARASTPSPAPRRATSPAPSPPTRPTPGLPAYVFIPADLEQEKILSAGAYGAQIIGVRGNYDDVNRLCTEVSGERESWAFVNVNVRPVLRRGLQDARLRDRRAARLGAARPRRRADRLRLAVHEGRARLPGLHRRRPA